jgi:light-regulated signal transduction histidine kinase (bacteriophytochrome)
VIKVKIATLKYSGKIKRMVIASHDLKEPVRKLKIYTDLLHSSPQNSAKNESLLKITDYTEW